MGSPRHRPAKDRYRRTGHPMRPGAQPVASGLPQHDAHTPRQGGGLYHDSEPSRSSVCAVFFEEVPHLIAFEDDGLPNGCRFGRVLCGKAPDPWQHGTRTDAEYLPHRVHRDPVTIEEHGQRLLPPGSPTWRGARPLIATASTAPALVAPSLPSLDDVWGCA